MRIKTVNVKTYNIIKILLTTMGYDADTRNKEPENEDDLPDYNMSELMHRVTDAEEVQEMMEK